MLSGDNGILQKATQSKKQTEKATVIELAQTEILEQIAENKGETISETQLKTILGNYFENIDSLDLPDDFKNSTITLTAKQEYGGYSEIPIVKIYEGKIRKQKTYYLTPEYIGSVYNQTTIITLYEENGDMVPITEDMNPTYQRGTTFDSSSSSDSLVPSDGRVSFRNDYYTFPSLDENGQMQPNCWVSVFIDGQYIYVGCFNYPPG